MTRDLINDNQVIAVTSLTISREPVLAFRICDAVCFHNNHNNESPLFLCFDYVVLWRVK